MAPQPSGKIRSQQIAKRGVTIVVEGPAVAREHLALDAARRDLRAEVAQKVTPPPTLIVRKSSPAERQA